MSSASSVPAEEKPSSSRSMIVYDREGELFWRKKGWFGSHSWKKYYAVLSCLRRCIYLFSEYYLYERHLLEMNGYENEFQAWSECIPLHTASIYVANTYFTRPHTFEICTPSGIFYMSAESESGLRGWLASFSLAGVSMKSDEKCLLVWRSVSEETCEAGDCFYYCRALSSLPPHERPTLQGWNSTTSNVQTLVKKLAVKVAQFTRDEMAVTPRMSSSSNFASYPIPISLDEFDVDFTPDLSYGKHGFMSKLSRSLFARLYSNKHASSDPSSPFFDPQAALEKQSASAVSSPYTRWVRRFYRTMESAAGKPVLVWYDDREDLHHKQPRNHIIPLSRARVFDLYSIRRRVEAAVAEDEEMAQRQRWKRMREAEASNHGVNSREKAARGNSNLSVSPNEESEDDSEEEEEGQPQSKRAKKAAFRARVNRCYLACPLFPEPLPSFAPYSQEDLALYVLDPSPRYIFLRADTPREKVKWVSVLRNLAGEVWNERNHAPASVPISVPQFLPTDPSKLNLVIPAASSVPVNVPLSNQLMEILPKKERKHIIAADGLDAIYNPRLAKKKTALALDELLEADLDEREIHVCRRDFYAILGVSCTANTELITHRYSLLHKDLLSKLIPKSPLHRIMPLPTTEEIQQATASLDHRSMNFAPSSRVTGSSAPLQASDAAAAAANGKPKGHKKARTFVFDQAELENISTAAEGSSSAASIRAPSVASTPLTPFDIEKKLQRQISELREIWRILKDPVRRTQYDERRCILRLDELKNRPLGQHAAANSTDGARQMFEEERYHEMKMQHHLHQPPKYDALLVKQEEHENPIRDVTLMSQDFSPSALVAKVDLDALLVRAARSAQSLPRSSTAIHPPNVLPIHTKQNHKLAAAADKEELYESKYNEVYESKKDDQRHGVSFADTLEAASSSSSSSSSMLPPHLVLHGAANGEEQKHQTFAQPSPKSRGRRSPSPLTDSSFHLATIPSNVHSATSASAPATTTNTPSPTSLQNLSPLEIASPNSQTLWMLGDEVEIRWNPLLSDIDASSDGSHFTHKPRSASVVFDPLHRVRLDLMRHRQLVKDTVMCQIGRECFNNGVCKFRVPLNLPPRSDYYVKLTLSYADAIDGSFSPPINNTISRSQLFCIQPFSKQERYVEGLESTLALPNGASQSADAAVDDSTERKPSPPPQWKKSHGNKKDQTANQLNNRKESNSKTTTTNLTAATTSSSTTTPLQSALPGMIASPTHINNN